MNHELINHMDEHDVENAEAVEFRYGLCENIFFHIVSRTSLQTYDLLRCTSKYVANLTYNDHLLALYNKINNVVYGYIIQEKKPGGFYSQQFVPTHGSKEFDVSLLKVTQILAISEQGFCLIEIAKLEDLPDPVLFICKASTMDFKVLSKPNLSYTAFKFAIVVIACNPLHYKIIRISQNKTRENEDAFESFQIEVFDSFTWRWTEFDQVTLPVAVYPIDDQPIVCRGSVFMLLSDGNIMRFDVFSQQYSHVLLPSPTVHYIPYTTKLVKLFGKLAYLYKRSHTSWDIWYLTVNNLWVCYIADKYDGYATEWWDHRDHKLYFYRGNMVKKVIPVYRSCDVFPFRSDFESITFTRP